MCTVTYLPLKDKNFILTSNRDEGVKRKPALMPAEYEVNGKKIIFPKDGEAGGTWIGISETNRLICLMNGAFVRHERHLPYRMSRGQVVLDGLSADSTERFLQDYLLDNIEPFTIVLIDWEFDLQAWELRWDGTQRHIKRLANEPQIWSSATLYDSTMHAKRMDWFSEWLDQQEGYKMSNIRHFHANAGEGDPITNLRTERGYLRTVSITSVEKTTDQVNLLYEDLRTFAKGSASFSTLPNSFVLK